LPSNNIFFYFYIASSFLPLSRSWKKLYSTRKPNMWLHSVFTIAGLLLSSGHSTFQYVSVICMLLPTFVDATVRREKMVETTWKTGYNWEDNIKMYLKYGLRMSTDFICPRTGTGGGLLWKRFFATG
jgi:hypothetical protein